jgi:starch synthase
MASPLQICFAASEVAPLAKTGGLADVAAALPAELHRRGHDVRLFMPFYARVDTPDREFHHVDFIRDVEMQLGSRSYRFSARTTKLAGTDLALYLIDCPELFGRHDIYTSDDDEAQRFALFSRAVIECCQRMGWAPDLFHCNDWHTALIPLLLRTIYDWDTLFRSSRTLMTIHNIGYQGSFPGAVIDAIGLDQWRHLFDQEELRSDRVSFLRTGLIYGDVLSTVSPTYAREIQGAEYGLGLHDLLHARRDALVGILNGVDYEEWSPETDAFIPHRYSIDRLEGKAKNKTHLLQTLGLQDGARAPLLGIVSRLTPQKGFDLGFKVLPEVLASRDLRLVALGAGETRYEEFFEGLERRFPGRVCFHRGYNDELAHVIEGSADMLLMPSRYEPCGLNQMFSLKYGTIPIVRRTGGLADTVQPEGQPDGTGFVFEHFTPDALRWALNRALDVYGDPRAWDRLVHNAMQRDFSWTSQAEHYLELYREMTGR